MGNYVVAYSAISGFAEMNEEETRTTGYLKINTSANYLIVITVKCTQIILEKECLKESPKIILIDGIPVCGETSWLVEEFNLE